MRRILRGLVAKNSEIMLAQMLTARGLMQLLMKNRNTGEKWTRDEIREIRTHLKRLSKMVPVIVIFLLPGGAVLLPFLAELLDRRERPRRPS